MCSCSDDIHLPDNQKEKANKFNKKYQQYGNKFNIKHKLNWYYFESGSPADTNFPPCACECGD